MTKEGKKKTAAYKFNDPNTRSALEKAITQIAARALIREWKSKGEENPSDEGQ